MTLPPFLTSRKFWALIAGALVIVLRAYVPNLPLSDETLNNMILLLVAYMLGTGLEDAGANLALHRLMAALKE